MLKPCNFALIILILVVATGLGCKDSEKPPTDEPTKPLGTKPPWALPREATEAERVASMRSQLNDTVSNGPDADILAIIYFDRPISLEEYEAFVKDYGMQAGVDAGYDAVIPGVVVSSQTFDAFGENLPDAMTFRTHVIDRALRRKHIQTGEGVTVVLEGLNVYMSPRSAARFWWENEEVVRAVGVAGQRGETAMTGWYAIRPHEPLR